ncbi:MAG: hypothetical protein JG782_694 [Anaerophaga sp.]|nr:hypothetical protein [Anaerophaga sp.]MDI3520623.1 hypothetical protein [Anaerophaga sp.]MDK2842312.1 hypothetical protein [Anaerophaga sp.]
MRNQFSEVDMILNLLQIYKDFEKPTNENHSNCCKSVLYICFELKEELTVQHIVLRRGWWRVNSEFF